ncbi:MAG: ROK family protein [Planctomycetaceae bacterium]|nr:ROK family protein [Planctomycetaceae bacterium]
MNDQPAKPVWVGFDLGGTKMMAVVFDDQLKILGRKRRKTRSANDRQVTLERLFETIDMAIEDADVTPDRVAGIGAGCPGPLDLQKGLILEAPNLGWKNVALKDQLEKRFKCPATICNDVDGGVFGEYSAGVAKGQRSVLGVFPGTGIGGGFVYEGQIFRGTRASCMEVGYLQLATEGGSAGVGPVGTLEGLASRLAISAEAAKAAYRGQAPRLFELAGTDLSKIRSSVLARAIEKGDTAIEAIVRRAAEQTGWGIGCLINILAPDMVVLGGGLVEALPKLYLESVREGIKRNVLPSLADVHKLRVAELGDLATAIGAAALIKQQLNSRS